MSEESNNPKSTKTITVLLICTIVALVAIVAGIFIGNALKNKNSKNVGMVDEPKTETTKINSSETKKYMASFKYDLKNNQLSNFDIAFLKVENSKENKIYSPLSIKYTLKMLEEGANGITKQQISNVTLPICSIKQ